MKTIWKKDSNGAPPVDNAARFEEILAASPSPFSDAVLANAFRETPDVPSIHAAVRQRCLELVHDARETGRTSLLAINGDAGEGKTHLIAWLRRQSEEGWRRNTPTGRFALTVIPPLRSLTRAHHHILQEVIRQLSIRLAGNIHIDERTDTPIEILIWRALLKVAKVLVAHKGASADLRARLEEVTSANPDRYLSSCVDLLKLAWPTIEGPFVDAALHLAELAVVDREVFRVLARFPRGDEPERTAIVDWLGGASLSSERLEALGTSLVLDDEADAARGLRTLLALAKLAGTPVALAFDQIEGTIRLGPDAVSTFLEVITSLYNDVPGTVLLIFCQTMHWPTLREQVATHVLDRLEDTPRIILKGLTKDEALLIVETRMKHFWDSVAERPSDPLFPLSKEQVLFHVVDQNLRTPRAVVRYFQALLREAPPRGAPAPIPKVDVPPKDIIRRKLDTLMDEEKRITRPPDSRAEIAQAVTHDVFKQALDSKRKIKEALVEEVSLHRARRSTIEGVRVVLSRDGERKRIYFESSNSQHGNSAASTMRRLSDVLETNQADMAMLLREETFSLPPAARKALAKMTPRGTVVPLAVGEIATLAAIESLLNAAAAGDVPVDRKMALDLAVEQLEPNLSIEGRIVESAFPVRSDEAPITLRDPLEEEADERPLAAILEHLRTKRAFEPAAHLASTLGLSVETVHAALNVLATRELVEVVADRNRSPVALLRPEALSL
ncbi:hypothetical protein LZC95_01760 [Pendulispora brunnea]|uniref:Orc1-like AAA ATPase domain-containing protein n=1 Tax=Pendulispora brunnea TaxID=2905690 RepID=A0ABZ2KA59_9BACT